MNQIYKYRKYLYVMNYLLYAIFSVTFSILVITILYYGITNQYVLPILAINLYAVFSLILYKRFLSMELILRDEFIYFKNNKKELKIKYEEIEKISFIRFSYFGGYMNIKTSSDSISLTVTIKNFSELLINLKQRLIDLNLEHLFDGSKFDLFYKTTLFTEESFRRTKYLVPVAIYAIISYTISFILDHYKDGALIGSNFLFIMYFLICYILLEFIIFKRDFDKRYSEPDFDKTKVNLKKEKNIYLFFILSSIFIHLIIIILIVLFI
jgi:hypothetical protein